MSLFKIEIKKINWKSYNITQVILIFVCVGLSTLLLFAGQLDPTSTLENTVATFTDFKIFFMSLTVMYVFIYSIFAGVLHSKVTVEEYLGKRSTLLFSYPFSRSKVLRTKTNLVVLYVGAFYLFTSILTLGLFSLLSLFITLPVPFSVSELPYSLMLVIIGLVLMSLAGIISMRIGFWKKSLVAPIVTSIIMIAPLSNLTQFLGKSTLYIILGLIVFLFVLAIIIMIQLSNRVNKMEIL